MKTVKTADKTGYFAKKRTMKLLKKQQRKYFVQKIVKTCDDHVIRLQTPKMYQPFFVLPPTLVIAIITTQFIIIEHRISPV